MNNKNISKGLQTAPWNVKCMYKFFNLCMFLKKDDVQKFSWLQRAFYTASKDQPLEL